jgi:type I restriction enzyme R subunit
MSRQSEQILEEQLIAQLQKLGYGYIVINSEKDLLLNLKGQLEKHNQSALTKTGSEQLTKTEFEKILNLLSKGSVFEKSKMLRQKQHIVRDNGDNLYFEFLNVEHWCQNQYQVTNQVSQEGKFKNRYDVTILINGLPLVQIELKRRGLRIKRSVQSNQSLSKTFVWCKLGFVSVCANFHYQQRSKYKVLRQQ